MGICFSSCRRSSADAGDYQPSRNSAESSRDRSGSTPSNGSAAGVSASPRRRVRFPATSTVPERRAALPSSSTASPPVAAAVEHDSDVVELRSFAKSAGDVETAAPAEASTSAASADAEEVVDPEERWADVEMIGGDEIDKLFAGLREKHVAAMEGVMESLRGLTRDLRESNRRMRETGEIVDEQVSELRAFQEKLAERWESIKATDARLDQKEAELQRLIAENAKRFNNADE